MESSEEALLIEDVPKTAEPENEDDGVVTLEEIEGQAIRPRNHPVSEWWASLLRV